LLRYDVQGVSVTKNCNRANCRR